MKVTGTKIVTLAVNHWQGEPPKPGEIMHSDARRPRYAYRVLAFTMRPSGRGSIRCERFPFDELQPGTADLIWRWGSRSRKRGRSPLL